MTATSLSRGTSRTRPMLYFVAAHALDALVAAGYEVETRGAPDANGDPDAPASWTEATAATLAEAAVGVRVATLSGWSSA